MKNLLLLLPVLAFQTGAQPTPFGLRVNTSNYDPATGRVTADLLNTSDKDITAAWLRLDITQPSDATRSTDYSFDQIWSVGLPEKFLPASHNVQIGAIQPGTMYRWVQVVPSAQTVTVNVVAVVYLGAIGEGDQAKVDQILIDRTVQAKEWNYWAKAINSAGTVRAIATQAKREQSEPLKEPRKVYLPVLNNLEPMLAGAAQSLQAGSLNEAQILDTLKEYITSRARVTAAESGGAR